jgi:GTPase KRas protein
MAPLGRSNSYHFTIPLQRKTQSDDAVTARRSVVVTKSSPRRSPRDENILITYPVIRCDYRIGVLGAPRTGKSCLIRTYTNECFEKYHEPTWEENFIRQTRVNVSSVVPHFDHIDDDAVLTLEILDTSGRQHELVVSDSNLSECDGFLLVYSLDDPESYAQVITYYNRICELQKDRQIHVVLVANMCDKVNDSFGESLSQELECDLVRASAKENINVAECFHSLVRKIVHSNYVKPFEKGNDHMMQVAENCRKARRKLQID